MFKNPLRKKSSSDDVFAGTFNPDMTLEEFLEVAGLSDLLDAIKQQGANSVKEVASYVDDLCGALELKIIPKRKLQDAVKAWKNSRKSRRRSLSFGNLFNPKKHVPAAGEEEQQDDDNTDDVDAILSEALNGHAQEDEDVPPLPPGRGGGKSDSLTKVDLGPAIGTSDVDDYSHLEPVEDDQHDYEDPDEQDIPQAPPRVQGNSVAGDEEAPIDDVHDYEQPVEEQQTAVDLTPVSTTPYVNQEMIPSDNGGSANLDTSDNLYEAPEDEPIMDGDLYENPDEEPKTGTLRKQRIRSDDITAEPEAAPLPSNPKVWNNAEVLRWLKLEGLGDFKNIFYSNGFGGDTIMQLDPMAFKKGNFSDEQCQQLGKSLARLRKGKWNTSFKKQTSDSEDELQLPPHLQPQAAGNTSASTTHGGQGSNHSSSFASPNSSATTSVSSSVAGLSSYEEEMVEALYDYTADKADRLSIKAGEVLTLVDSSKRWWKVRNASNKEGLVPSNFVQKLPTVPRRASQSSNGGGVRSAPYFHQLTNRAEIEAKLRSMEVGTFLVRPSARDPNKLTLSANGPEKVFHLQIEKTIVGYTLGQSDRVFANVDEVVEFHKTSPMKISNRGELLLKNHLPH